MKQYLYGGIVGFVVACLLFLFVMPRNEVVGTTKTVTVRTEPYQPTPATKDIVYGSPVSIDRANLLRVTHGYPAVHDTTIIHDGDTLSACNAFEFKDSSRWYLDKLVRTRDTTLVFRDSGWYRYSGVVDCYNDVVYSLSTDITPLHAVSIDTKEETVIRERFAPILRAGGSYTFVGQLDRELYLEAGLQLASIDIGVVGGYGELYGWYVKGSVDVDLRGLIR